MKKAISCLAYTILFFAFFSCIPQNKIEYLQDPIKDQKTYELQTKSLNIVKPNDELFIKVSSFDDLSFNFFSGEQDYSRTGFSNELSISLISYTVNDSGYINFPVLGDIYVKNLSLEEIRYKLQDLLKDYFNQPTIIVKFAFKKVTVLGEVNNPGYFTYTKEHINVFEALSMAGDITRNGNINEVYLLRENDTNLEKRIIDLSDDDLLFKSNYYIKSGDIIYVQPRISSKWSIVSTPVSLILSSITTAMSTITTALLVLNYLN